ncbi:MAG: histidine phosphatase family protein [Candidatus Shapirobacteria bacterium]|nr:histidine phosphatase family protein [Candidatus Shapirobacteria bacterium]MDD4383015.1 histidine phosphatase family protein [Candidatus Shapirobacteria bacterium]
MVKDVFFVRHGDYSFSSGKLNSEGIRLINILADEILPYTLNKKIVILSSSAIRTLDSAEIISNKLNIRFETKEILCPDNNFDLKAVFNLIQSYIEEADILILVTHLEYTDVLPYYFACKQLKTTSLKSFPIPKGSAWHINCVEKTIKIINPQ